MKSNKLLNKVKYQFDRDLAISYAKDIRDVQLLYDTIKPTFKDHEEDLLNWTNRDFESL